MDDDDDADGGFCPEENRSKNRRRKGKGTEVKDGKGGKSNYKHDGRRTDKRRAKRMGRIRKWRRSRRVKEDE